MTRLCRFNENQLGIVEDTVIFEVTGALDVLSPVRFPFPAADLLIANLDSVIASAKRLMAGATRYAVSEVQLLSPVANPPKIIAAPVNYLKHQAEANQDGGKNFEKDVKTIDHYGLFLKSNTSLVGVGKGIEVAFPERRTDHEIELVAVIGKSGRDIPKRDALKHIAGYTIGLDITLRGTEDRSLRKSLDSFSVLGPWLVTADEIVDPNELDLILSVNGVTRQNANTRELIFSVERLVEYASAYYELKPGDLIYTGTPEGVGPIAAGDVVSCKIAQIGETEVNVYQKFSDRNNDA